MEDYRVADHLSSLPMLLLPGSCRSVHELKREARAIGDDTLPWLAFLAVAFVRSDFHSGERQDRPRRRFAVIVPSAGALDRLPIAVLVPLRAFQPRPHLRSCPSCIFFRSPLLSLSLSSLDGPSAFCPREHIPIGRSSLMKTSARRNSRYQI